MDMLNRQALSPRQVETEARLVMIALGPSDLVRDFAD
jgi:hypothetical protein